MVICLLALWCLARALTGGDGNRAGTVPLAENRRGGAPGPVRDAAEPDRRTCDERGPPCADGRGIGRDRPTGGIRPPRDAGTAVMLRVVDGDTVVLLIGRRATRVRLIGVDAPETWRRHDCFGAEATRALRGMLPPGSRVRVAGDREPTDRYGRRLLYLWAPANGPPPSFVPAALVRAGLARAMDVPPNSRYAAVLGATERAARRSRLGLWGACAGGSGWPNFQP